MTREETIAKLEKLGEEAKAFGKNHAEKTIFAIDVVYIGFKLSYNYHTGIIDKLAPRNITCTDGSITIDEYILTQTGHTLNLLEFIERIAQNPNVQLGLLEDWQGITSLKPKSIDYIAPDAVFIVFTQPDHRNGYGQIHHIPQASIETILPYFKRMRSDH